MWPERPPCFDASCGIEEIRHGTTMPTSPAGLSGPAIPCGKARGEPVGQQVLRRLEAALETPFRDGLLVWERPEGAGPGVRKCARPRTRRRPSDCRVAPSPVRPNPAAPAARDSEAQDLRAQQLPPPRRCARPERRGAHRHPMSFSRAYAAMTHGAGGAQVIGRGLPRGASSARFGRGVVRAACVRRRQLRRSGRAV